MRDLTGHGRGQRVLVARLDNAGDVLLTGPAVRAIRASANHLTFMCGRRGEEAVRLLPGVDEAVVFEAPWIDDDVAVPDQGALLAFLGDIAARGIDEAFIFTSFHQSPLPLALLLRLAGIPTIAAICDDFPGRLLDVRHRVGECHEVERALSLVATRGYRLAPDDDGCLRLLTLDSVPAPHRGIAARPVVVHPGASVPARTLSARQWTAVAQALAADGHEVVVTGGPTERGLTAEVATLASIADLGGQTDLEDLAALFARAAVVVCGNTGPAHLAAAVHVPVVAAFPPTVPAVRWRPWGVRHVLLGEQDVACAGCRARACPLTRQVCLDAIRPSDVVNAVRRVLSAPDGIQPWAVANAADRAGDRARSSTIGPPRRAP